ncbi:MAG: molecular chaperone HtpG, partial [Anaerolineales bacterium]
SQSIAFKAETRQILDILIHSLYTEREIFLRELISNASDALTRVDFEILTNRQVLDPEAELAIRLTPDQDENTLTIQDTGIGMTPDELIDNLGTIAHSGAQAFVAAAKEAGQNLTDIIGQFGVGFYSAFMVAEWIKVTSRSYRPDAQAASWFSKGDDTFTVEPAEKTGRGTDIVIKFKEDATEFLQEHRLRQIIRKHSDFIPYPIYFGDQDEQVNRKTALWRQNPKQIKTEEYEDFYKQLTLDIDPPLASSHMVIDAPVQMYAVLFVPTTKEHGVLSLRREDGLKLFARKVLIQEYCKDLLPEYFRFIQGVVDSEDLPLNVSRETIQSNRLMNQLKKLITSKVIDMLEKMAKDDLEKYERFWTGFGRYIKEGVAVEQVEPQALYPLLRFRTTTYPDRWSSIDDYLERMKPDQKDIYFILGDDEHSVTYSPHLDLLRSHDYEVLTLTDAVDAFMIVRLNEYKEHTLVNVASATLDLPEIQPEQESEPTSTSQTDFSALIDRFKHHLGDRVADVRMTSRLTSSPARLVDPEGVPFQEVQRVYRMIQEDYEIPKKVLELNQHHNIVTRMQSLSDDHPLNSLIIEQIFENALLVEGLHPDPVGMIPRLQQLIEQALP